MAENNNNNVNTRENLSEMDKIFIPEDLDGNVELSDFTTYKKCNVKFWRSVPENYRLVTVNWFTNKIKFQKGFGIKLVPPIFTRTILVPAPMLDGVKTFKDVECLSKDKIEVKIDLSLSMNITDPAKYMRKGKTQLPQLTSIIKRLLRVYVANKNFDDLVAEECQLNRFDLNGALINFEKACGIKVNKVIFEKVQLPERLKKLYNDAAEEEQRKKAQTVRLKAEKEKAQNDAEVMEIRAKAEASRIEVIEAAKAEAWLKQMRNFVEYLESKNIPTANIADILTEQLKIKTATENNANTIFNFGNGSSKAADIAAGVKAATNNMSQDNHQNSRTSSSLTNSEKLLNDAKVLYSLGQISKIQYEAVKKTLEDINMKQQIDNCSQNVYNIIAANFLSKKQSSQEDEIPQRGPRR